MDYQLLRIIIVFKKSFFSVLSGCFREGHVWPEYLVGHDPLMNSAVGYNPKQNSGSEKQCESFLSLPLHRF